MPSGLQACGLWRSPSCRGGPLRVACRLADGAPSCSPDLNRSETQQPLHHAKCHAEASLAKCITLAFPPVSRDQGASPMVSADFAINLIVLTA